MGPACDRPRSVDLRRPRDRRGRPQRAPHPLTATSVRLRAGAAYAEIDDRFAPLRDALQAEELAGVARVERESVAEMHEESPSTSERVRVLARFLAESDVVRVRVEDRDGEIELVAGPKASARPVASRRRPKTAEVGGATHRRDQSGPRGDLPGEPAGACSKATCSTAIASSAISKRFESATPIPQPGPRPAYLDRNGRRRAGRVRPGSLFASAREVVSSRKS